MILVDTSVWSIALRRQSKDRNAEEVRLFHTWRDLLIAGQLSLIGPIRQEVLSGITSKRQFEILRGQLDGVFELELKLFDWDMAAEFFNTCRAAGIAPDTIDMTICAAAHTHAASIFTTDPDFTQYAKHLPITLHKF